MNVKIQGGGSGTYANKGSCTGVVSYLEHEDTERMKNGQDISPFFNDDRNSVTPREVTYKIDNNKAKLCNQDAKFYVITVSPSQNEIRALGRTPQEQTAGMREYIRNEVMQRYADGFGKGLNKENIEYYAKIHFDRSGQAGEQMHVHIIVSRKDKSNSIKLSPQTNHRTAGKGAVKSGFDRYNFFLQSEKSFDLKTGYARNFKESFEYFNAMKKGSVLDIQNMVDKAFDSSKAITNTISKVKILDIGKSMGL